MLSFKTSTFKSPNAFAKKKLTPLLALSKLVWAEITEILFFKILLIKPLFEIFFKGLKIIGWCEIINSAFFKIAISTTFSVTSKQTTQPLKAESKSPTKRPTLSNSSAVSKGASSSKKFKTSKTKILNPPYDLF